MECGVDFTDNPFTWGLALEENACESDASDQRHHSLSVFSLPTASLIHQMERPGTKAILRGGPQHDCDAG